MRSGIRLAGDQQAQCLHERAVPLQSCGSTPTLCLRTCTASILGWRAILIPHESMRRVTPTAQKGQSETRWRTCLCDILSIGRTHCLGRAPVLRPPAGKVPVPALALAGVTESTHNVWRADEGVSAPIGTPTAVPGGSGLVSPVKRALWCTMAPLLLILHLAAVWVLRETLRNYGYSRCNGYAVGVPAGGA
jgi:hypothetical protein